jgi:transposase
MAEREPVEVTVEIDGRETVAGTLWVHERGGQSATVSGGHARTLGKADFLLGIRDDTRQRAIRFRRPGAGACRIHRLTTRLAKTHGAIVVEGLDAAGMLRQKGLAGARARRRGLSDSALGETRRQLAYKAAWYGSSLVIAGRFFPSSRTCHACGHVQDIGWAEHWACAQCGTRHQRDDNAAVNLARYEPPPAGNSAVGPVGAAVKRRADRKTGPRPAGGREARKGPGPTRAGKQPRNGVPA